MGRPVNLRWLLKCVKETLAVKHHLKLSASTRVSVTQRRALLSFTSIVAAASSPGGLTIFLRLQNQLSQDLTDPFPWLLNCLLTRRCVPRQTTVMTKQVMLHGLKQKSKNNSMCMSNFSRLPHPPRAFSGVLVYLSICPRPRSHAIELAVLLEVSGVSTIEFKMGGTERCIEKSRPFKTRTGGTAGQRHQAACSLYTSAHGCLFPFSGSAGCIDLQSCTRLKTYPGNILWMGGWAYTSKRCEPHHKGEKGSKIYLPGK